MVSHQAVKTVALDLGYRGVRFPHVLGFNPSTQISSHSRETHTLGKLASEDFLSVDGWNYSFTSRLPGLTPVLLSEEM